MEHFCVLINAKNTYSRKPVVCKEGVLNQQQMNQSNRLSKWTTDCTYFYTVKNKQLFSPSDKHKNLDLQCFTISLVIKSE